MKRFTETSKWDDPWFRALKSDLKLMFLYVIDRCNNAGFWEMDEASVVFHLGLDRVREGAWEGLSRGLIVRNGWVWVKNFLKHQKHLELSEKNPAHRQIIGLLNEQSERFPESSGSPLVGAEMGLSRPIGKGIGTGNGNGTEGMQGESAAPSAEIPTESEWIVECAKYSVPDWFALEKYYKFDSEGWGRISRWRSKVKQVSMWHSQAGRPMHPPGGRQASGMPAAMDREFSDFQLSLSAMFQRPPEQPWSADEWAAYDALPEIPEEDVMKVKKHFRHICKMNQKSFLHQSLLMVLRKWNEVLDEARRFKEPTCF